METILNLLNSYSMIIVIATIMVIAFAKCIIKIFRMGVTFKTDIVTREELADFESESRRDMRGYAVQIQKLVTDAAMKVIDNRLKDMDETKKAVVDMKVMKAELETEIKNASEKYDDIKTLSDTVRNLSQRIQRLEYNEQITSSQTDRRSVN